MASQIAEVVLRKKVSAKSEEYYIDTQTLGDIACDAFLQNKTQVRNLENIANSAIRVTDIFDFIKRQTGRSKLKKQWQYLDFGQKLLNKLDEPLRNDALIIFNSLISEVKYAQMENDDLQRTHMFLCREYIRHLSAHYLYRVALLAIKPEEF